MDFDAILDGFSKIFHIFWTCFWSEFRHLFVKISFQKPTSHKPMKPENTTNPQTTIPQTRKHNKHKNPQSTDLKS
jgi:hypothetical protein